MSKELVAGQKLQTYEIISTLGYGGMSRVYLCEDLVLNRRVALKQLLTQDSDSRSVIRLQQEGQSLARLSHPNIVKILTYFNTDDGAPFLVMELLHGCSLAELLKAQGSLSVGEVMKLAQQLCDALQHAHDQGIVHRDIKPSNIFLCNKKIESAKIIDFGIAKIADNSVNATRTGEFVGSPAYLSPEQALQKDVTTRSDQYSLGCVLYECLTGHPPFEDATAMGLILKHINEEAFPLGRNSFVPPVVAKAIDRSLRKDPEDRFTSMDEFKNALEGKAVADKIGKLPMFLAATAGACLVVGAVVWTISVSLPTQQAPSRTSGTDVSSTTVMPEISQNPNLSSNVVSKFVGSKRNGRSDEDFVVFSLKRDPNLANFPLSGFAISEKALNALATSKHLQSLHLGDTNIEDNAADRLAQIKTLEILDVSRTNIGDAFVEGISVLPKIRYLSLGETNVSSHGLEALSNTPSLREISLRSCERIDDSAGSVIKRIPHLRTLDVVRTDVTDQFVRNLGTVPNLTNLSLSGTKVTPNCLASVGQMKSLKVVYFDELHDISDLSGIEHLPLEILSLRACNIGENTVRQIAKFKKLWLLRLDRSPLTNSDLLILAQLPKLKLINLAGCPLLSKEGIAAFKKIKPDCKVITESVEKLGQYRNSSFRSLDDVFAQSDKKF